MSEEQVKAKRKEEAIAMEERRKAAKYSIQQRLVLIARMPAEGEYFNIKSMRIVREELGLNDDEQKAFESSTVLIPGATVTDWKVVNTAPLKAVDVGEWLASHFRTVFKKQFDEKKIRDETVELYDIFCGAPQR